MVPADSRKIPRVPRYSGYHYASFSFEYRTITVYGPIFQRVLLTKFLATSWSYNPNIAVTTLVCVWYDSTKIHTTPHNNMTELYFEDNDIEGIIEKLESGKYVVSYVTDLMELECGQKLVRFYDPSGNLIEVRTPVSHN